MKTPPTEPLYVCTRPDDRPDAFLYTFLAFLVIEIALLASAAV